MKRMIEKNLATKTVTAENMYNCKCLQLQPEFRPTRSLIPDWLRKYFVKPTYWPAQIDFYARWIAPSGFLIFNLIYWTACYTIKKIE